VLCHGVESSPKVDYYESHCGAVSGEIEERTKVYGQESRDDPLILKRAPIGDNEDDHDFLENGVVVGRIFTVPAAPEGRP
jgi:hypothetical protein